ncbi:TonB-dependent receptor [Rhizorhapis suberifaciens]|uniref:Iron complex outermembrane receptor protein n=1 Tax=Rhizorhapis suberifaciens TaxID=13656 RepID=A0A840HWG5_9SPHN|nr:TonB-dependent receptor [Rhizorhapis suberifaciens]MBB4641868.1 iron complex outermembrane receptor protein [Rhizorhapis suberifaciens]
MISGDAGKAYAFAKVFIPMRFNSVAGSVSTLALIAVIAVPVAAHAESAEMDGGSILVVGQKDKPIEIAPRGLAVSLGQEQMEAVNAVNTEDLMKYAPNFFVRKRYSGDSNGVPGFRGTHSTQSARTLVMVDGFVVSNFLGNSFGFAPKWGVVGPGEVEQFDIVYGPYSSRYAGNSMGGIINIITRDPKHTEVFTAVQGFVQPYDQFSTRDDYYGFSGEAGLGWKQKDRPFSVRLTGRFFRNDGHPMSFYGLTPVTGAAGMAVTGSIVDPEQARATAAGTGIPNAPGTATNPIFAAQSPARITQNQAKLKVRYDDGNITGQFLFAFWHNEDSQTRPDCYLRDASGNVVCDGRVSVGSQTYTASGANFSKTLRDEFLTGLNLAAPFNDNTTARLSVSTYQIVRSDGFTSDGYAAGRDHGPGVLAAQGPTGWWSGDLTIENKTAARELAFGFTVNHYETDQFRYSLGDWASDTGRTFSSRTFGKSRQLSGWAEARWLLDPLTISMGVRYDNWRAFDGGLIGQQANLRYASREQDAVSPSLSFEYLLDDATQLQLSLAMATRFPTVGELFQGSLNGDGSFNAGSFDPNLRPERSKDANLLIAHHFGRLKLTGSAFYQQVKNTIFSFTGFNLNGVLTNNFKNIDCTRQYGLEMIAETHDWPLPGMNIDANAAYINAKTLRNDAAPTAEGAQFPRIPKWRFNANLRYAIADHLQGSLGMRYASRPNTDLFGLQRGDGFGFTSELFALDARLNWDMTDHFRLSAGVDNITNDRAWVFHPYPQRTFLVEAGWRL